MKRRSAMNLRSTNPNAIGKKQGRYKNMVGNNRIIFEILTLFILQIWKLSRIFKILISLWVKDSDNTISIGN